jgi:hypothetical protein
VTSSVFRVPEFTTFCTLSVVLWCWLSGAGKSRAGGRAEKLGRMGSDILGLPSTSAGRAHLGRPSTFRPSSIFRPAMSTLVDAGANVKYDHDANRFAVQPKGSKTIYSFCRKQILGNESKFYVCNMDTMVDTVPTQHPSQEETLVTTVANNFFQYTKREVLGTKRARELLPRLGYPSVENAIAMLRDGTGFDVDPYDFKVTDVIWGPDIASLRGKTTRAKAMTPDAAIGMPIVPQQQLLVVDIMFIDQVSSLSP